MPAEGGGGAGRREKFVLYVQILGALAMGAGWGASGRISDGGGKGARDGRVQTCNCEIPEAEGLCHGVGPEQGTGARVEAEAVEGPL